MTYHVDIKSNTKIDYTVESASDYYPYGKALRSFGKERYQSTYHERDVESGFDYRGARFYDGDIVRFNSLDPLAMDYSSWNDYHYVLGNPIILVDPTGMGATSTHTDKNGNVLAVYDDGDNGVYRHNDIESPDLWYGNILNVNLAQKIEAGHTERMGETLIWDSFYSHDAGKSYGCIDFNSFEARDEINTFEGILTDAFRESDEATVILGYMKNAGTWDGFDFKSKGADKKWSKDALSNHRYRGSLLAPGIYVSARDVGNFEAGFVSGVFGLPKMDALKMKGAFNAVGNNLSDYVGIAKNFIGNWTPPYGETPNSHKMQATGYNYGQFRNKSFYKNAKGY